MKRRNSLHVYLYLTLSVRAHSLVSPSPALGSKTSSTANRTAAGNSYHSDGSVAQPDLHVTSRHQGPPSQAKASHPGSGLWPVPPPFGGEGPASAELSPPGRRPSPGPDLLLLLWAEACAVDTEDTGSTAERREDRVHQV